MPAARTRDAQIVAALRRRLGPADATALSNFAWFAARRGEHGSRARCRSRGGGDARCAARGVARPRAARRRAHRRHAARRRRYRTRRGGTVRQSARGGDRGAPAAASWPSPRRAIARRWTIRHSRRAAWNGLAVLHEQRRERAAADGAWQQAIAAGSVAAVHNQALAMLRRGFPHRARSVLAPWLAGPERRSRRCNSWQDTPRSPTRMPQRRWRCSRRRWPSIPSRRARSSRLAWHASASTGTTMRLTAIRRALLLSPWYRAAGLAARARRRCRRSSNCRSTAAMLRATAHTDDVLLSLGRSLLQTAHLGEALAVFDQVLVQPSFADRRRCFTAAWCWPSCAGTTRRSRTGNTSDSRSRRANWATPAGVTRGRRGNSRRSSRADRCTGR